MSNPLRVVHLGKYYPPSPGGIEGHTQTLARAQAALGADVRVLVVNHATPSGRDATFDRFTRTPDAEELDGAVRITRAGRLACIAKLDVAPNLLRDIRRLARAKPDVWHMHAPNVTMMLAVLACPAIHPLVITHHSDIIRQRLLKYAVRPIESAAYRRAARILSDSSGYIDGSPLLRHHLAKVEVLPLGINSEPFRKPSPARSHSSSSCANDTDHPCGCASAGSSTTRDSRSHWLHFGTSPVDCSSSAPARWKPSCGPARWNSASRTAW